MLTRLATAPVGAGEAVLDQRVTFFQHSLPGLEDGTYQLDVAQRIVAPEVRGPDRPGAAEGEGQAAPITGDPLTATYRFAVLGDRFTLTRPDTVFALFPGDNAAGEFGAALPHAVLSNPTLPWARHPTAHPPTAGLAPGADTERDVPSWLAILLLDSGDVAAHPGTSEAARAAVIGDLFPKGVYPDSTLGEGLSYFRAGEGAGALTGGESLADPIQILDLPLTLFWQVAPTLPDLALLAHVRRVDLGAKPTIPGISDIGEPVGDFSVVVSNRLPATGRVSTAYLVSLEGLEDLLPSPPDGAPPAAWADRGARLLRLAVLRSWSFTATGEPATFTDALQRLNGRPPGDEHDAPLTALRHPPAGDSAEIARALDLGYVPLDHDLRDEGRTVSWYRGPLVPVPVSVERVGLPVTSADAALVFDPTSGLLDASYAAAWTLGRLLALQDKAFSVPLYRWKRGLQQQAVAAVENALLHDAFAHVLGTPLPLGYALAGPRGATRALLPMTLVALARAHR
jgi:hypothetical protein